jgi:hypothetical protein
MTSIQSSQSKETPVNADKPNDSNTIQTQSQTQSQTKTFKFTCQNCKKGYDKKMFHCLGIDCCSSKCLDIALAPILAQQEKEKEEYYKKNKSQFNNVNGAGGVY